MLLPAVETADLERSARRETESSDDDSDAESPEGARDPKEREAERLRVLEAAGLLVRDGTPSKRRSTRRAAPARPPRRERPTLPTTAESEDEEPSPEEEPPIEPEEQEERMEDAFDVSAGDRYCCLTLLILMISIDVPTSHARATSNQQQPSLGCLFRHHHLLLV